MESEWMDSAAALQALMDGGVADEAKAKSVLAEHAAENGVLDTRAAHINCMGEVRKNAALHRDFWKGLRANSGSQEWAVGKFAWETKQVKWLAMGVEFRRAHIEAIAGNAPGPNANSPPEWITFSDAVDLTYVKYGSSIQAANALRSKALTGIVRSIARAVVTFVNVDHLGNGIVAERNADWPIPPDTWQGVPQFSSLSDNWVTSSFAAAFGTVGNDRRIIELSNVMLDRGDVESSVQDMPDRPLDTTEQMRRRIGISAPIQPDLLRATASNEPAKSNRGRKARTDAHMIAAHVAYVAWDQPTLMEGRGQDNQGEIVSQVLNRLAIAGIEVSASYVQSIVHPLLEMARQPNTAPNR